MPLQKSLNGVLVDMTPEEEAAFLADQPAPPTPEELRERMPPLTPRQLRLALVQSGTPLSSIGLAIDAIADQTERGLANIEWNYANQFNRTDPLLAAIAVAVGYTDEQVDSLWTWAATL